MNIKKESSIFTLRQQSNIKFLQRTTIMGKGLLTIVMKLYTRNNNNSFTHIYDKYIMVHRYTEGSLNE